LGRPNGSPPLTRVGRGVWGEGRDGVPCPPPKISPSRKNAPDGGGQGFDAQEFQAGEVAQVFLLALGQEGALEAQFVAFLEADFRGADGPDFAG
jgi:hypothetical protein